MRLTEAGIQAKLSKTEKTTLFSLTLKLTGPGLGHGFLSLPCWRELGHPGLRGLPSLAPAF